jgi:hypothetical protein
MPRKQKLVIPVAKCHVEGCQEDAAYGFREMIDVSTMEISDFIMGVRPNWCRSHDAEQRPLYFGMNGDYVKF